MTIQAPFIDEKTIQGRCKVLAEEFKSGKRKCLSSVLEAKSSTIDSLNQEDAYQDV